MSRFAFYMASVDRGETVCQQWKKKFMDSANTSGANGQPIPEIPATRGLDVVRSMLLLERNQLEEAESLLVKTLDMLGWGSWMELHGFIELVRLRHTMGNDVGVEEVLQRMSRLGPQHVACTEALRILFDVKQTPNDPQVRAKAEAWTKAHSPDSSFPFALGIGPYHRDTEYICNLFWARMQIALGHFKEAATFVNPALESAKEHALLFRVAELSILKALIQDGQGNSSTALEALSKALEISETCGYTRFFDDGPELDRLLQQAAEKKIHAEYARQLLTSFHATRAERKTTATTSKVGKWRADLVDPLSERELEVLRLLASGLPPAEVAKKLFLSPFTLKAHTQNIYAKLSVHSRIEAINKAREMELL
jgi:ATP/maltotriose-dependent transcriptional regulator MalT